jgi:hypothetical protein
MKNTLLLILIITSVNALADEIYEQDLFAVETKQIKLKTEQQFINFIQTNMPSTFVYYQRLDSHAQKRVFKSHQNNEDKDITELVLTEYRNRG